MVVSKYQDHTEPLESSNHEFEQKIYQNIHNVIVENPKTR